MEFALLLKVRYCHFCESIKIERNTTKRFIKNNIRGITFEKGKSYGLDDFHRRGHCVTFCRYTYDGFSKSK